MIALISEDIATKFEQVTQIKTIALSKYNKLDLPVSSHADMLACVIENTIFLYKEYYLQNKSIFNDIPEKYQIVLVEKECKKEYPSDIGLNVLIIGKKLFCNKKYTAKEIIDSAVHNGYKIINVNQGYAACSTMVIDENNAITGDKGMYQALIKEGINTVLISPSDIQLDGYNHGFIGGSSGVSQKNAYFFGNIENLTDSGKILALLDSLKVKNFPISSGRVYDFGGAKIL